MSNRYRPIPDALPLPTRHRPGRAKHRQPWPTIAADTMRHLLHGLATVLGLSPRRDPRLRSVGLVKHKYNVYCPIPEGGGWCYRAATVLANTASEARAAVKRQNGLRRLPVGAYARKVK